MCVHWDIVSLHIFSEKEGLYLYPGIELFTPMWSSSPVTQFQRLKGNESDIK